MCQSSRHSTLRTQRGGTINSTFDAAGVYFALWSRAMRTALVTVTALLVLAGGAVAYLISRPAPESTTAATPRSPRFDWVAIDNATVDAGMVAPSLYRLRQQPRGKTKVEWTAEINSVVGLASDRDAKSLDVILPSPEFNEARSRLTCGAVAISTAMECSARGEAYVFLQSQRTAAEMVTSPTAAIHNRVTFTVFAWRCIENCT
jgi:hypothetical protein